MSRRHAKFSDLYVETVRAVREFSTMRRSLAAVRVRVLRAICVFCAKNGIECHHGDEARPYYELRTL